MEISQSLYQGNRKTMISFTINSKELLRAIQYAGRAVNPNATIPILQCVLLEVFSDGVVKVTGSDMNTTLITKTKASEVEFEGNGSVKIAVPFDLLPKVLISLPSAPITITYIVDGLYGFRIELQHETSQFDIPCEDGSVYLKSPEISAKEPIRIPAQILQRGIDNVVHCVAADPLRPALTGIGLIVSESSLEFAATDGFKMGVYKAEYQGPSEELCFVLPAKLMQLISELIGYMQEDVELLISNRMVGVEIGEYSAYGLLIEEKYPDYQNAIPVNYQTEATLNAEELKTLIKRGRPFADPKTNIADFTFKRSILLVRMENPVLNTKSDQDMSIQSDIEEFSISFNTKLLESALSRVSGEFTFRFVAAGKLAMVYPDQGEGEELKYFVWPTITLATA